MENIPTLKELNKKRAKALTRYLQALNQGKRGRSLGAFKGWITRRAKAIAAKVKELRENPTAKAIAAKVKELRENPTAKTVKECKASTIGAIVAVVKSLPIALVQRLRKWRSARVQPITTSEAIQRIRKGATEARASKTYQLAQQLEEAGDRLAEMEGMQTMAEIYKTEELEELDRWSEWNE